MPRRARLALAGIPWHIIQRANNRALFRTSLDEALVEEIRLATNGTCALGGRRCKDEIEAVLGRRAVRGIAGRPPKAPLEDDRQQSLC